MWDNEQREGRTSAPASAAAAREEGGQEPGAKGKQDRATFGQKKKKKVSRLHEKTGFSSNEVLAAATREGRKTHAALEPSRLFLPRLQKKKKKKRKKFEKRQDGDVTGGVSF